MSKRLISTATVLTVFIQVCFGIQISAEKAVTPFLADPPISTVPLSAKSPIYKAHTRVKATWIWDTTLIITEPKKIMKFAKQEGINLIYLQMDESLEDVDYIAFNKLASSQGIEIHALAGDPHWVQPAKQAQVKKFVAWVKDFNSRVSDKSKFRGVHLDVEPYVLPSWHINQSKLVKLWMDTVAIYAKEIEGSGLISGVDIPFWLDEIQTSKVTGAPSLAEWIIDKLDQVTIMAYRSMADTDNGIIALVASEAEVAERLKKKIIIAVESLLNDEASYVSYYNKGRVVMAEQLHKVEKALNSNPAYAGYAVHDYVGWQDLKQ